MFPIEKEKIEASQRVNALLSAFSTNPDALALSLDKSTQEVFLSVYLSDVPLSTRGIGTKIYNAAIRKGIYRLGLDVFTLYKQDNMEKKLPDIDDFMDYADTDAKSILSDAYKEKLPAKLHERLQMLLDTFIGLGAMVIYMYNTSLSKSVNLGKDRSSKISELYKFANLNVPIKIGDKEKVWFISIFNKIFDLHVPYHTTIQNVIEKLYLGYGVINPVTFDKNIKTKGKSYWAKAPAFASAWLNRRNEILAFFDSKLKEHAKGEPTAEALAKAYANTATQFYDSIKFLEFYGVPVALAKNYPLFKYAIKPEQYYCEITFSEIFKDFFPEL